MDDACGWCNLEPVLSWLYQGLIAFFGDFGPPTTSIHPMAGVPFQPLLKATLSLGIGCAVIILLNLGSIAF